MIFLELINKYNLFIRVTKKDIWKLPSLRKLYQGEIRSYQEAQLFSVLIYADVYGQDAIDTWQHHNISEIAL
jgi:hypothetical protein